MERHGQDGWLGGIGAFRRVIAEVWKARVIARVALATSKRVDGKSSVVKTLRACCHEFRMGRCTYHY